MLPFENAKLLPKSKVFEEQVAARAKEASGHDRQKPQQAHHETSFARVHAKAGTQPTYLIRQQIAILASHSLPTGEVFCVLESCTLRIYVTFIKFIERTDRSTISV
jgi:hypothetical protein